MSQELPELARSVAETIHDKIRPVLDGRPAVVFFLFHFGIARIGHFYIEPMMIRTLFPPDRYQLFVVHPQVRGIETNPGHQLTMQGIVALQMQRAFEQAMSCIYEGPRGESRGAKVHQLDNVQYMFISFHELSNRFYFAVSQGCIAHRIGIPVELSGKYEAAVASLGISPDQPVVTLHVREAGFDGGTASQSYRNARIENYLGVIRTLAADGFRVIRIGDQSMTRLPDLGPNVLDAAYAPVIAQAQMTGAFVEACAIVRSEFFIGMPSGPQSIAMAACIPTLILNAPVTWVGCSAPNPEDLVVFRKYYISGSDQPLSFSEIGRHPVFDQIEDFGPAELGLDIEENSPELIGAAVAEMRLRLAQDRRGMQMEVATDALFRRRVAELQAARHAFVQSSEQAGLGGPRMRERAMVSFGAPWVRLSSMSIIDNPRFLD